MTRPVVSPDELESLDLADPQLHAGWDLSEVWRRLRGEEPFHWQPSTGDRPGFWVLTRHADAMAVYRDRDNFTTERGNALENLVAGGDPAAGSMLAVTDGAKHTRLRNVLNAAFAPKTLARIRESLRRSIDELLAAALEKGEYDFVHDVAEAIPLGAICDLLGVPRSDRRYLLDRTANAWSSEDADRSAAEAWQAKSELLLYFADVANSRRGTEADDVISLLANCRIDGAPISDRDLMANCYGLIIGGDETGRHALSNGLKALIEHPGQWRSLKDGKADLVTAADEVLRWTVPSLHGGRTATADVTVNGQRIRAGDIVTVWISSANRDEAVFADPDSFLLHRKPNKHLTFAFGAHICLGHNLARIEVEEVLGALRARVVRRADRRGTLDLLEHPARDELVPGRAEAGARPVRAALPLAGITVVALEQAVAAPLATRHLADLGARVIKVERVDGGDFARGYDTNVHGLASHFVWLNRGKESVALDLKAPGGEQVLADLVATADVFVQNLAPGAADRLGFGAARLRARHPMLVTVDMSGYGGTGPYRDRRAYDMLIQCEAGLVSSTGPTGGPPTKTGIPASDIAAGMYALSATLAALVGRSGGGAGAAVEISMLEATAEWMGYQINHAQGTGSGPRRMGLSHPTVAPYGPFPAADGAEVVIGVQNDREWVRFATGFLDRPELATDPAWATNVARVRHRDVVDALVSAHTSALSATELVARLDAVRIACGKLNDINDVLAHPQLAERDRWRVVATLAGPVRALLPPFTISGTELPMGPVPALGEHTVPVLRRIGYSDERIEELCEGRTIAAPVAGSPV